MKPLLIFLFAFIPGCANKDQAELHNIWVSKKKDRCFYYSKTSHHSNNFYYAFPSVAVFKKVQNKWIFEKNLNR